jgi:hypothetical protein
VEAVDAVEDGTLVLRHGRRLGYAQYGRGDGEPLVYFYGHPGSRLEARLAHSAAVTAGLRVIALDRPGYGLSDLRLGRSITDWPADVAEAADLQRAITSCPERTIDAPTRAMSVTDARVVRGPDVRDVMIADVGEAFRP